MTKIIEGEAPPDRHKEKRARLAAGYGKGGRGFATYAEPVTPERAEALVAAYRERFAADILKARRMIERGEPFNTTAAQFGLTPVELRLALAKLEGAQ